MSSTGMHASDPRIMAQSVEGWTSLLEKALTVDVAESVSRAYQSARCHPQPEDWFAALREVGPPEQVRVCILGQDPYHGPGQAHGLSFSVPRGVAIPPSLRNIFKEVARDCGGTPPAHGDLRPWAAQGVLLLNDVLSVEEGQAASHAGLGWQAVTGAILGSLQHRPVAFLLWGRHARSHRAAIEALRSDHFLLEAPHPSPLSAHRGFLGCGHFGAVNRWLSSRGETPIEWFGDPW